MYTYIYLDLSKYVVMSMSIYISTLLVPFTWIPLSITQVGWATPSEELILLLLPLILEEK